ncbi:MAG: lamin tail domain-containing protein [Myxococcales bacterium]
MNRFGWIAALLALAAPWALGCPGEPPKTECTKAEDCAKPSSPCVKATCSSNKCGTTNLAENSAVAKQTLGDCVRLVCDGKGNTRSVADDADIYDDGNPCTFDKCEQGTGTNDPSPAGTDCSASGEGTVCDGQGTCITPSCGDNKAEGNEACDGTDLASKTCQTQGFGGGTLSCKSDCSFDTSLCTSANPCGNGAIDGAEKCDGSNLNGKTCQTEGFTGGTLSCKHDCTFELGSCTAAPTCGNTTIDGTEQCDGSNLNGKSCQTQGFASGALSCNANCTFNTALCVAANPCGNGTLDAGEDCDGSNLNGKTCVTQGFASGTLKCNATTCKLDTSSCTAAPTCGNTTIDGTEQCDGSNLNGKSCLTQGFASGTLSCNANCTFNTAQCVAANPCGNGALESNEDCDGSNLNGKSCLTQGFASGSLKCNATTCKFDTSSCVACGNGALDSGEECDGSNLNGKSCLTQGFASGTLKCNAATCKFDTSSCIACGNGALDSGEECDGSNLNNKTCLTQGFASGTLKCNATTCKLDTSSCIACGNGTLDAGEDCDGSNLSGKTCLTQGFASGTLKCNATCKFDTSSCVAAPTCGNATLDSGEECDGSNLNGKSCASLGYAGGSLTCSSGCKLIKSACTVPDGWTCTATYFGDGSCDCGCGIKDLDCANATLAACKWCDDPGSCNTADCPGTIDPTDNSKCVNPCGNGAIDSGEQCDGSNLNGKTCASEGFASGSLTCGASCQFNTSGCTKCGNGTVDSGEQCDGSNLNAKTCATQGFAGGTLSCGSSCQLVTSGCTMCGNNAIDGGEVCDGTNLNGKSCATQGFAGGTLSCSSCAFNTSGCTLCGNNAIDGGEVCDGTNLNGKTCATQGFAGGTLSCSSCAFNTSGCTLCGNNAIDGSEVCDGTNLNGKTCATQGFAGGTLSCSSCAFNTSGCTMCGNNVLNGSEACDGTAFGGKTCATIGGGFTGGTLACSSSCALVTTGCTTAAVCNNGVLESGEVCDGSLLGGRTCVTEGYTTGTLGCTNCALNTTTACTGMRCGVAQALGTVTPVASYAKSMVVSSSKIILGSFDLNTQANPDYVSLELYEGGGPFTSGLATGTFQLTASEQQYSSCSLCVVMTDEMGKTYLPTGGSVTLTAVANRLTGTLNNVSFQEVTISSVSPYTSTPVTPNGCTSNIASMAFDAAINPCGDGQVTGNEVCDGTNLAGATCTDFGYGSGTPTCNTSCSSLVLNADNSIKGCTPATGETTDAQCLNGNDDNTNGWADCEEAACRQSTTNVCKSGLVWTYSDGSTCTDACNLLDDCGWGLPDLFSCSCSSNAGCDGIHTGYRCYTELASSSKFTHPACGAPCQNLGSTQAARDTWCTYLMGATSTCNATTGACSVASTCGNGTLDSGEQCDGSAMGGATCVSLNQGFTGGTLTCNAGCTYNTSQCTTTGASCTPSQVVISQVYGGGASGGTTAFQYDFIELHNRSTTNAATLTNWTVQYGSSTGTGSWTLIGTITSATIPAGGFYLVRAGTASTTYTNALPTPDLVGATSGLSATAGKVALVNGTAVLTGANPTGTTIVDLVGFGAANGFETAPTAVLSITNSAQRNANGCTDTNNNSTDFTVGAATVARNSSTAAVTCGCQ